MHALNRSTAFPLHQANATGRHLQYPNRAIEGRRQRFSHCSAAQPGSKRLEGGAKQESVSASAGLARQQQWLQQQAEHKRQQAPHQQQQQPRLTQPPQRQQGLLPDPVADDLDLLAAAAAATVVANAGLPTLNSTTGRPAGKTAAPSATAVVARPGQIASIPDAEPKYVLPAGRQLRYAAADKMQLSGADMRDIGRRLRSPRMGSGPLLRIWR
jgi:hypothetical protein